MTTICWVIWKARNELIWNNKHTQTSVAIASAKIYLVQWRNAQRSSLKALFPTLMVGDGAVSWVKPQETIMKVTVDARTFSEYNSTGVGTVARDTRGELIQARPVRTQGLFQ